MFYGTFGHEIAHGATSDDYEAFWGDMVSNWQDIGHGHRIQITQPDSVTGIRHFVDEHKRPDNGKGCSGAGRIIDPGQAVPDGDHAYWTLESENPLTLSPSLHCTACNDHGFVQSGQWVPV